ncbi:hypothetical protein [Nonomuraea longicatena]|uniref:Antibiotic biosynthesis monooxygenase n=1 Tax=Nonomuraea longicatena TaxID=83682 RepID=A0ABP4A2G3_9ACTN
MPDLSRSDVDTVLVTRGSGGAAEAERMLTRLERLPWPRELVSFTVLVGTDGSAVLGYLQCAGPLDSGFVADVTGSVAAEYRVYRSLSRADRPVPGCVVVVDVEFDGPDAQRQRRWIDTVLNAVAAEPEPHPGGISGHFHVSTDGARVLNYAEWTDEDSHRDALAGSGRGMVGSGPAWRAVQEFPGVRSGGFTRYRLLRTVVGEQITEE